MNLRSSLSVFLVVASGVLVLSCRRRPERVVTLEEAQTLGRQGEALARKIVQARTYVVPDPFVPVAMPTAERDAAIESLVRGRELAAKKQWPAAREAFDDALRVAPFDDGIRRERDRAARGDAAAPTENESSAAPKSVVCGAPHATVEDLCNCLVTSDEGEHCLPIPVPCAYVGDQTRDGSLFVLRVGRDDELGSLPRYFVGARQGEAFHAVREIARERGGRGNGRSREDTEITTAPARTGDGTVLFQIDIRQSEDRAGLVDLAHTMTKRSVFCVPPSPTAPAHCPVDIVTNRRETRAPSKQDPPLPAKLAARLSAVSAPFTPVFVHVGREITNTGVRAWLIDGNLDQLPPNTVGFRPFR